MALPSDKFNPCLIGLNGEWWEDAGGLPLVAGSRASASKSGIN